jgi:uncharacterized protein YqgC (DUF456 family)
MTHRKAETKSLISVTLPSVDWYSIAVVVIFALMGLVCLLMIPLGLPGTWLLLGAAVFIELIDGLWRPGEKPATFGWPVLAGATALAGLGEVMEFAAGAMGARWGGATRRGVIGALVGAIAGAVLFSLLIPIPFVGTLLGALVGTFVGALLGEATAEKRRHPRENVRAAIAASIGRLAGTLGKLAIGAVVWVWLVRAAYPG